MSTKLAKRLDFDPINALGNVLRAITRPTTPTSSHDHTSSTKCKHDLLCDRIGDPVPGVFLRVLYMAGACLVKPSPPVTLPSDLADAGDEQLQ